MDYVIYDCEQGSEEWFAARAGKITASSFGVALERLKRCGSMSKRAIDYAHQVAHERIAGYALGDKFNTWQMQRGTELEWEARAGYEAKTGMLVKEMGVIATSDGVFGYSTDGLAGDDGLIEIKTPSSPAVLSNLIINKDYSEYIHQIQGGLWITGRKWCDLVIYAPQLEKIEKDLIVQRIDRNDDFIEEMEQGLVEFSRFVLEIEQQLRAA